MEIIEPKGIAKITAGQGGCVCSSGSADANQGSGTCVGSCDYGTENSEANARQAYCIDGPADCVSPY